jgi:hypothetical protein
MLSASPANPDAVLVVTTLTQVAPRQRSASIFAWAAAYLRGEVNAAGRAEAPSAMDEDAFMALVEQL